MGAKRKGAEKKDAFCSLQQQVHFLEMPLLFVFVGCCFRFLRLPPDTFAHTPYHRDEDFVARDPNLTARASSLRGFFGGKQNLFSFVCCGLRCMNSVLHSLASVL